MVIRGKWESNSKKSHHKLSWRPHSKISSNLHSETMQSPKAILSRLKTQGIIVMDKKLTLRVILVSKAGGKVRIQRNKTQQKTPKLEI